MLERDAERLYSVLNGQPYTVRDTITGATVFEQAVPYDEDAAIWAFMLSHPTTRDELYAYLASRLQAPDGLLMTVADRRSDAPIGMIMMMNSYPEHLKIELGNILYAVVVQASHVNAESTYLCLAHLFSLGYQRVEWKCNAGNARSRRAALRLGFAFEGVQDFHFVIRKRRRDTAWYCMLAAEWAERRRGLETFLFSMAQSKGAMGSLRAKL